MAHDAAPLEPRQGRQSPAGTGDSQPAAVVAALVDLARPVERQRATRPPPGPVGASERSGGSAPVRRMTGTLLSGRLPRARTADVWGAALVALLAGWTALGARNGESAGSVLWLLCAAAVLFAVGRWLTERVPLIVHRLVALAIGGSIAVTFPGVLRAAGAPLGYANANAALAGVAVLAALGVAVAEPDHRARVAWTALAGGLVLAIVGTGSYAGGLSLLLGSVLLAGSALLRRPAVVVLGGAVVVVLALGFTAAIAHGADPGGLGDRAGVRGQLWGAAAELAAEHPLQGVGPGNFAQHNPVSDDADLRWAHHGYLQMAAETGLAGLALLLALVGWVYARLGLAAVHAPHRAALGAAVLTVVALHATVDHVLHHAAVVLTLAAVLGAATARPPRQGRGTQGSRRPPR